MKPGDRWVFLAVLLGLAPIFFQSIKSRQGSPDGFLIGDCLYYRAVIDSILDDGDLLIANNIALDPMNGQLAFGRGGLVPKHPILMPLVALPFYWLWGTPGLLAFNLIDLGILLALIFMLNRLFFGPLVSAATTFLYATLTLYLNYAYNFSPDIFASTLFLAAVYLAFRNHWAWASVFLGLSIFAKAQNVFPAIALLGYEYWFSRRENNFRPFWVSCGMFVLALVPFFATNFALFGSPFVTGYNRAAIAWAGGTPTINDHALKFTLPFWTGVTRILFDAGHGLFPTNWIVVTALPGIIFFPRVSKDKFALLLILCAAQIAFLAKYRYWYGESHYSNRFMMTVIALLSVFTSQFLNLLQKKFPLVRHGPNDN